jgi:maltooligosyltrehalose synthase
VHGATGYEFADLAGGLFVDGEHCDAMDRCYRDLTGLAEDYDEIIRRAKTGMDTYYTCKCFAGCGSLLYRYPFLNNTIH